MLINALLAESAFYWFGYVLVFGVAGVVILAMTFGAFMTLRWFLKGGRTKPGATDRQDV